jgi:hypothetical protein
MARDAVKKAKEELAKSEQEAQALQPPPLPETIICPLGLQINKLAGPNGTEVLLHFVTAGHIYTIRLLNEATATEIASKLAGGIVIASANELPPAPEVA